MPSRLTHVEIEKYRSVNEKIRIDFPINAPLVLIGENNAGKSNILRALNLILGESWPGSYEPDDHEYWGRDPDKSKIKITVGFSGVQSKYGNVNGVVWEYGAGMEAPNFQAIYPGNNRFINKSIMDQCTVVMVGADRRLSYQLSYTNKWTLLAKLMKRFHKHLISDEDRVDRLKGKFSEIKDIFEEVSEFTNFQTELRDYFMTMLEGMTYRLSIDFSAYDPSNYFQSLRIFPTENSITRNLEELGTGQEQVLALAFAHAYAKAFHGGIVLAIEEPESHLHPLAQLWLSKKIQELTRDGLQIVLTTHSPAFVEVMGLSGIVLVQKTNDATSTIQITPQKLSSFCIEHGADSQRTNDKTILPFYASHSTQEILSGLFAKKVVLVEGQTEHLALPILLGKVDFDVERMGVAIIPVMGKGNLAKWWRFFNLFEIPTYVIFDNDNRDDKEAKKRIDLISIFEENHDKYIATDEWIITEQFAVFGKDFEHILRTHFSPYKKLEDLGKQKLGDSKPIIARYVARKLEISEDDLGYKKLTELKNAILSITFLKSDKAVADDILPNEDENRDEWGDDFDVPPPPEFPDDWISEDTPF